MMIATLLVALFAAAALASVLTLADAAARGRNAFRLLRGDLARVDGVRAVTVVFEDRQAPARMPALRPAAISAARVSPRKPARTSTPLRAAA